MRHFSKTLLFTFASSLLPSVASAQAIAVSIQRDGTGFHLTRAGKPYFVLGAGGDGPKRLLKDLGGNSFRLWGADPDTADKLDEAQQLGLTVTLGLWLRHDDGFDYADAKAVAAQFEKCKAAVLKYKDHPALLMWSVGNEMEGYKNGDDPNVWKAVEQVAAFIKSVDKNHPVMTVTAEIGGDRVKSIETLCPSVDIHGINTYGGCPSIPERYAKASDPKKTKPYLITEFGPPGTWEMPRNSWNVVPEFTSTKKAEIYKASYEKGIASQKDKLCLGSYVFTWGAKQEATATWFGMFLHDGARLETVDTMGTLWSGHQPKDRCPTIEPLKLLTGSDKLKPGDTLKVSLTTKDPEGRPLRVKWTLDKNAEKESVGGETQPKPPTFPEAFTASDLTGATLTMPAEPGGYWLYARVYDAQGGAAIANLPLFVAPPEGTAKDESSPPPSNLQPPTLVLSLYADGLKNPPYAPSGWMGDTANIALDDKSTDKPHSGTTCMKCEFKAATGFGGVVWQSPANDWGDQPGGHKIVGATRLAFWARGAKGDETVTFKLGILGKDKKHPDSTTAEFPGVKLTKDWKQYTLDLKGKDLTQIKTGFCWTVDGAANPGGGGTTFFLDDIRYEK